MRKATLLIGAVIAASIAGRLLFAGEKAEQMKATGITVRKAEAQTVLYTIYRGPYEKIGAAIGELYATAGKNRIAPRGGVTFVYLNNPTSVAPEHFLTEIRIPVGEEAKKLAGKLGAMTDVKTLGPMEVATMEKAAGDMDYQRLLAKLYTWLAKNGYYAADNASETFSGSSGQNPMQAKSEIAVPVEKVADAQ